MTIYDDLKFAIGAAALHELQPRPDDLRSHGSNRGPVGIQGVILDQMDAGRISGAEANELLKMCHERIAAERVDLSGITVEPRDDGIIEV